MAKDKKKKERASSAKADVASRSRASKVAKVAKAAGKARKKAADLAANPVVAEIVAAALVATAAAIKNPKKARDIAASAADELKSASKDAGKKGNAMWLLALDVARRSIDALGEGKTGGKAKGKSKAKRKKTS
jgi:hypothetical protein